MTEKILCVDDEPNVLHGIKRQLRNQFDLDFAVGPRAAKEMLVEKGPYAVVVTDMRMPEMSGVELLAEVRRISAHTTRLMLTGNADQQTAVEAVNRGHVFRFLNKPCSADDLTAALQAGLEQYRLVVAEKELLSKTLAGSMSLLSLAADRSYEIVDVGLTDLNDEMTLLEHIFTHDGDVLVARDQPVTLALRERLKCFEISGRRVRVRKPLAVERVEVPVN